MITKSSSKTNLLPTNAKQSISILINPNDEKFSERPTVVLIHGWIVSGVLPGKYFLKIELFFDQNLFRF